MATPTDPPECTPKTLVLCFDGTTNQFDNENTNVVKLFSLLQKDRPAEQLCYYQPGIGTYFQPGVVSPLFQWAAKLLDEAFAWYLYEHVTDGYRFIMQNYCDGDRICIFGFSRGAYTARALAGLLHKIGLLPKDNAEQLPFAYKIYKGTDAALAAGFKRAFCKSVAVEFVGVWDTVASVGVLVGRNLPFTTTNTTIRTFRHALALDEHRVKFTPNLYHRPAPSAQAASKDPEHASAPAAVVGGANGNGKAKAKANIKRNGNGNGNGTQRAWDAAQQEEDQDVDGAGGNGSVIPGGTDVLEVWFAGCHSDVGGGATPDATERCLSDITLRWMVRELVSAQAGVLFAPGALEQLAEGDSPVLVPAAGAAASSSAGGTGAGAGAGGAGAGGAGAGGGDVEQTDMVQPVHDQLGWKGHWAWWMLEVMPLLYAYQDAQGVWHKTVRINFGRGRQIPDIGPRFHVSVRARMADKTLKYSPRAVWKKGSEVWAE